MISSYLPNQGNTKNVNSHEIHISDHGHLKNRLYLRSTRLPNHMQTKIVSRSRISLLSASCHLLEILLKSKIFVKFPSVSRSLSSIICLLSTKCDIV